MVTNVRTIYHIWFNRVDINKLLHVVSLMEPVVLEAMLCDVLTCDDPGHAVIPVQHHQVTQTHRSEETISTLDGAAHVDGVRRGIHVRTHIQPAVLYTTYNRNRVTSHNFGHVIEHIQFSGKLTISEVVKLMSAIFGYCG